MPLIAKDTLEIAKNWLLSPALSFKQKMALAKRLIAYKKHRTGRIVFIEISNVCNAKCYFCTTGFANLNHTECKPDKAFIEVDFFEKIVQYLKRQNFLNPGVQLHLFNWKEPLLHPEFSKIIEIATREDCLIGLSTNANVLPKLPPNFDASRIVLLILSMPGFSQASYDKIHQFDFELIKRNIAQLVTMLRKHGFIGKIYISYHLYQFNLHELQAAYQFAHSLKIGIEPTIAYINDGPRFLQFLEHTLPEDYLYRASQDLLMGIRMHYAEPMQTCPLWWDIIVNPDGQCEICCAYKEPIGSVFDMTLEKLTRIIQTNPVCKKCMASQMPSVMISPHLHFDPKQLAKAFQQH